MCAGEEFSAATTRDRKCYTWGLGIAGQLGHGDLQTVKFPKKVDGCDGKCIETLSLSQGQVLAMCSTGEVYHWGVPGVLAHMVELDPRVVVLVPEKIGYFTKTKRRVRQLVCGRKHYIAITVGSFAPNCYVEKGLRELGVTQAKAGSRLSFKIRSADIDGVQMEVGGGIWTATIDPDALDFEVRLRKQLEQLESSCSLMSVTEMDDDMDGCYSGMCKFYLTGTYRLSLTLDGLAIRNNPFEIEVKEGDPFGPNCSAWWGKFANHNSANDSKQVR